VAPVELLQTQLRDEVVAHLTAGTSVGLVGLPGSGRSTLASAVADALDDSGWSVVRVYGVRALRTRPLEALAVAGLGPRADGRAGTAVSAATTQLRTALAGSRAVLVVDDVDVLDETSSGAIAAAHALGPFPVLSTSRPQLGAHVVPGADVQPAVLVSVDALGFDVFQNLLTDLLPGPVAAGLAGRLFTLSGGLPRLALTILDLARRTGAVREVDGVWRLADELFSLALTPAVEPFLDDLTAASRSALETLALLGTVPEATARELASTETLAEIEAAGLVRFANRGQDLVVGLYPHAVAEYLRATAPRFRRLALADVRRSPSDDEPVDAGPPLPVRLPAPSGITDPRRVKDEPETSGTVLNRLFLEEWYRSTLARRADWEREPSVRTALPYLRTLVIGDADPRTMRDLMQLTPATGDPVWRTRWTVWRANVHAEVDGDLPAALACLDQDMPDAGSLAIWLRAARRWMEILHATVPAEPLTIPATRVPMAARQSVENVETLRRLAIGDAVGALAFDVVTEPGTDLQTGAVVDQSVWTRIERNLALVADGRYEEALASSRSELERARVDLDPDIIHGHGYVVSVALLLLARISELRRHLSVTLSIGLRSSLHRQFEAGNRSIGAALAALEGRTDTAQALARQATELHGTLGPFPVTSPTWALGQLDVREHGDSPESRHRAADALWEESRTLLRRGAVLAGCIAGSLSVDFASDDERLALLEAAGSGTDSELLRALFRLARVSDADTEEVLAVGRELVAEGQVLIGARALAHAAGRIQRTGDAERLRATLTEARDLVRRHGGEPALIVRPVHRAVGLTTREREIATLVVAGRSNEEIATQLHLSLRTVQNNLGRVFAKVGVRGRADLTRDVLGV
jgi:DNA-binding CsgD family transcriptional regulator